MTAMTAMTAMAARSPLAFVPGRLPLIRRVLTRIRKQLTPRIADPHAAGGTGDTARLAQGSSPVSAPAKDPPVSSGQGGVDVALSPSSSPSRSTGAPALSKERLWKEDGRYLISYRFPEAHEDEMRSPDEGGRGSSGEDGKGGNEGEHGNPDSTGENGVGDHESASLGSDTL
jgi:hypothetical protein